MSFRVRVFCVCHCSWPGKTDQAPLNCHSPKDTSLKPSFSFHLSSLPISNLRNKSYYPAFLVFVPSAPAFDFPLHYHWLTHIMTLITDLLCSMSLSHLCYVLHTNDNFFLKTLLNLFAPKNFVFLLHLL